MAKKKTNATRAPDPVTEAAARASAELTELEKPAPRAREARLT